MTALEDNAVALETQVAGKVAAQDGRINPAANHRRHAGRINLPESRAGRAGPRAVGIGRRLHAGPPAGEAAGSMVKLVLEDAEELHHLRLDTLTGILLGDELIEMAHARPRLVVPLEIKALRTRIEDAHAVTVGALRLVAGGRERMVLANLDAGAAPASGPAGSGADEEQAHGIGGILILYEAGHAAAAVGIDETLQAIEPAGLLRTYGGEAQQQGEKEEERFFHFCAHDQFNTKRFRPRSSPSRRWPGGTGPHSPTTSGSSGSPDGRASAWCSC